MLFRSYDPEFQTLHQISTAGTLLLLVGLLVALYVLIRSLVKGERAPANPWGGATLEWHCTSPPPFYNFDRPPAVGDPYDFSDIFWDTENERYVTVEPDREIAPTETPEPAHAESTN